MPRYIFANGKVRVAEDKFAPLVTSKAQFTDSVVLLLVKASRENDTSMQKKDHDDVQTER